MNWALGESSDDDCDIMGRMGGRLMYFLCIFGMPYNWGIRGCGGPSLRKRYTCLLSWSLTVKVRFCSFLLMTSVGYSSAGLYVVLSVRCSRHWAM